MRSCLNAVTTGYPRDLHAWVGVAQRHGFDGVEFPVNDLAKLVEEQGLDAARRLQIESGVSLAVFGLPVEWRKGEDTFRKGLDALDHLTAVAAAAGCSRASTYVLPSTEFDPGPYALQVVRRLRACCEVLGAHGIRLAIEWVGTPSLRQGKTPFLWTAGHAVELCDAIGLSNAGLLFDSWHWYTTGASPEDLERVPAGRIMHVHVNDAPDLPMDQQRDNVRLLPGDSGVIDLVTMLSVLEEKGYDGFTAIETFSKELPQLGVEAAAGKAKAALDGVRAALDRRRSRPQ